MKTDVVEELNTFLAGNYMAIHAYESYIHHVNDPDIKQILQNIQQNHKRHAGLIAERIQNLDGMPVDGVGMKGVIAEWMSKLKGTASETQFIIKDALKGEDRGIAMSKKLLDGDLDPESLDLVKDILKHDQEHIELLNEHIFY